jgi:hypothetical protein
LGEHHKITTLTIASVVLDSEATERALMFLPVLLPAGIGSADPMIQSRNKTYPVFYERPSSVSTSSSDRDGRMSSLSATYATVYGDD